MAILDIHSNTVVLTYAVIAAVFLARNTYRWLRWERHWPGTRLWTLPFRSAFWPVAWIGLDWSPVRWVARQFKEPYHDVDAEWSARVLARLKDELEVTRNRRINHGRSSDPIPDPPPPPPAHRMPDPTPAPPPKKPDVRVSATQAFMAGMMTAKEAVDCFEKRSVASGWIKVYPFGGKP